MAKQTTVSETSDYLNPKFLFSTTYTDLLVKIAKGEIDAVALAKAELKNRYLDENGNYNNLTAKGATATARGLQRDGKKVVIRKTSETTDGKGRYTVVVIR